MGRFANVVIVSRKCLVASLTVLVLVSSSYGHIHDYNDLASWEASLTTPTLVEDFESESVVKDTALASFTSNGNTYIGLAGVDQWTDVPFANVYVSSPGYTNYGVPLTESSILTANGNEDFMVIFGSPTNAVAFDFYLNEYGPASVTVHSDWKMEGHRLISHDPATVGFLGLRAHAPIRTVRWKTFGGWDVNTGIDNIRQGTHAPAPGAIVLCTIGTSLVGWISRRRTV